MQKETFKPEYGNASRPGLLSDGNQESEKASHTTTFREDYSWPKYHRGPCARRKQLLHKFLLNEIADKYIQEMTAGHEETEGKTSLYKDTYKGDGFDLRDIIESASLEEMAKYPLYTDQAHSVYFDKIKKIKHRFVSNDPQATFRKCSYFSRPFYAELED